jgi:hypothetical protein
MLSFSTEQLMQYSLKPQLSHLEQSWYSTSGKEVHESDLILPFSASRRQHLELMG